MQPTTNRSADLPSNLPAAGAAMRPIEPPPRNVNDSKLIEPAQPPKQVSFTIHALLDDFPIDVNLTGSVEQLRATVARLRELGVLPPTAAARREVAAERQREAPRCEFHGPMKESSRAPGTWFCTKKMGDDSYCKSRA